LAGVTEQQRFENKTELEPFKVIVANYLILDTDKSIEVRNNARITLPISTDKTGQIFRITNTFGSNIMVYPRGTSTINYEAWQQVPPNSSMSVQSDGPNWRII